MRLGLVSLVLVAACAHHATAPRVTPTIALVGAPVWRSLEAEHRVVVSVSLDGGKTDVRKIRGLIAVQRPDRFRLRALGPAGITLFDLLVRNGATKVISAIRAPSDGASGQALADVVAQLASDLACAYALAPSPAERSMRIDGDAVLVEEPGRRVRLSQFAGTPATWRRAEIETGKYRVTVDVDRAEVDTALDPTLFDD